MYLLDTNILLELFLEREKAPEVQVFISQTPPSQIHISEFTFYSLGMFLSKRDQQNIFLNFIEDMIQDTGVTILKLEPEDMELAMTHINKFKLDFDDSYQYTLAQKYHLTLLSFDKDFDRTELGRKTPAEVVG